MSFPVLEREDLSIVVEIGAMIRRMRNKWIRVVSRILSFEETPYVELVLTNLALEEDDKD